MRAKSEGERLGRKARVKRSKGRGCCELRLSLRLVNITQHHAASANYTRDSLKLRPFKKGRCRVRQFHRLVYVWSFRRPVKPLLQAPCSPNLVALTYGQPHPSLRHFLAYQLPSKLDVGRSEPTYSASGSMQGQVQRGSPRFGAPVKAD